MADIIDLLDPDVAAMVRAIRASGRGPLHTLGVAGARALSAAGRQPPAPEMGEVTDTSFDGPHGPVPVRSYRPHGVATAAAPAIVYFHGGGMILGSIATFDSLARHLAAACGAVVLSVDYRLAPENRYPVATDEAYAALLWATAQAGALGIDPARLAVAGDSAGGSLAAGVTLRARDENGPRIAAQLLLYPGVERAVDRPSLAELADAPMLTRDDIVWMKNLYLGEDPAADTAYGVPAVAGNLAGLPPAIVVSAQADPLRDGVEDYGQRLRAACVPTALLRYPGVCHGFLSQTGVIARAQAAMNDIGALTRVWLSDGKASA
jgi:acetyl esterase